MCPVPSVASVRFRASERVGPNDCRSPALTAFHLASAELVGLVHSASNPSLIRASTSARSRPSRAYASAACRATSTRRRPQAAASSHVDLRTNCCGCPGAAHTRRTSTALRSASADGNTTSNWGPLHSMTVMRFILRLRLPGGISLPQATSGGFVLSILVT